MSGVTIIILMTLFGCTAIALVGLWLIVTCHRIKLDNLNGRIERLEDAL